MNSTEKNATVYVYGSYGRDANGKRIRKKFAGRTEAEAMLKRAAYEQERALGIPDFSEKITVAEWVDMWKTTYKSGLHGTNRQNYDSAIARLLKDLGPMRMVSIRNIHLQNSLMRMAGMSESSTIKYRMVLQQIFKKARQNKIIREDPAEELELPDATNGEGHRALVRWETELITKNWMEHRTGVWMMIMLYAGLRRSEMIALNWDSVDLEERTIDVHRAAEIVSNQSVIKELTKTEAGKRVVPICDPLFEALSSIPKKKRTGQVCLSAHGKQISQSAFDRGIDGFNVAMERILNGEPVKQQGRRRDVERRKQEQETARMALGDRRTLEERQEEKQKQRKRFSIKAHDLRYTFATAMYDAGIDVKSAQYYLGHSDVRTTMNIYTQLSDERKKISRAQLITFLDNWLNKDD